MRWLERYLTEGSPRLQHFAEIAVSLAKLEPDRESTVRARRLDHATRSAGAGVRADGYGESKGRDARTRGKSDWGQIVRD
jgi:hypothetical protein